VRRPLTAVMNTAYVRPNLSNCRTFRVGQSDCPFMKKYSFTDGTARSATACMKRTVVPVTRKQTVKSCVTVYFCTVFVWCSSERFQWRVYCQPYVVFCWNPVLGCKSFSLLDLIFSISKLWLKWRINTARRYTLPVSTSHVHTGVKKWHPCPRAVDTNSVYRAYASEY